MTIHTYTHPGEIFEREMNIRDFRLHEVYEYGLKSVKNKCNNWKENSLLKTTTMPDPTLGANIGNRKQLDFRVVL
jgi:hypothetical protein